MNAAHFHLLINHLPILGSVFGLFVLLYGFTVRNHPQPVRTAAYLILLIAALGAMAANWSGEGAEDLVENFPGVTHDAIEAHEEAAEYFLWIALATGATALAAIVLSGILPALNVRMALAITLLALLSTASSARVGWLGGKIRHTEIDAPAAPDTAQDKDSHGDGD